MKKDIVAAYSKIASDVRTTPVSHARVPTPSGPLAVSLKHEYMQCSGSFKARGAMLAVREERAVGTTFCAASGGNHGAAAAWAARSASRSATIFVPTIAAESKKARIRSYGARLVEVGDEYEEARVACRAFAEDSGAVELHAFDSMHALHGQGTVAFEWSRQAESLDTLLVAVGGGGLIAGVAGYFEGSGTRIVGVETTGCGALAAALSAGERVDVPVSGVAADALGARRIGSRAFEVCQRTGVESRLVSDAQVEDAMRVLWTDFRIASEPAGAAALAALCAGVYVPESSERVGVLLCGANVDVRSFPCVFGAA
ncbi:MAG: serine/threonine dehydratase [Myxococcota bacterium]